MDDVAVPVVVRRLDQNDPKDALGQYAVHAIPQYGNLPAFSRDRRPLRTLGVRRPLCNQILCTRAGKGEASKEDSGVNDAGRSTFQILERD